MSTSAHRRSPMGRYSSDQLDSPVRRRGSPHTRSPSRRERSPARHRSSPRARSPVRNNSSRRARSPAREKPSSHAKSPKRVKASSPVSRSPSPRTVRLRRAQAGREVERTNDNSSREADKARHTNDREHERNSSREADKARHRERNSDREVPSERRSARVKNDDESSRSRHGQSTSPTDRRHRNKYSSRSPSGATKTGTHSEVINSSGAEQRRDDDNDSVAKVKAAEEALEAKQKQKPSFELSGKLAAETNRVRGITLLFTEPPDARKPDVRWRLYVFKAGEVLNEPLYVHRQSCYLFGRERRVADIPTDHPSCSKQHAVIQFRQVEKEQPDGTLSKQVRPYLMDLGSTNGTFLNDNQVESQRYYELIEKDTIRFGNSSREYVILHENSAE